MNVFPADQNKNSPPYKWLTDLPTTVHLNNQGESYSGHSPGIQIGY